MTYKIIYKSSVERDLKKLAKAETVKVLSKIENDLSNNPEKGEPLKGNFQGLYRYRIGDYRVIYTKTVDGILVLRVGHRRDVYK